MIKLIKILLIFVCFILLAGCVPMETTPQIKPAVKADKASPKNEFNGCKEAASANLSKEGYEIIYVASLLKGSLANSKCRVDIYAKKDNIIYATAQELGAKQELLSLDIFDVPFYKFEINYAKQHEKDGIALAIVLNDYNGADISLIASSDIAKTNFWFLQRELEMTFLDFTQNLYLSQLQ